LFQFQFQFNYLIHRSFGSLSPRSRKSAGKRVSETDRDQGKECVAVKSPRELSTDRTKESIEDLDRHKHLNDSKKEVKNESSGRNGSGIVLNAFFFLMICLI
jgi:hypothetical protein